MIVSRLYAPAAIELSFESDDVESRVDEKDSPEGTAPPVAVKMTMHGSAKMEFACTMSLTLGRRITGTMMTKD